MKLTKDLLGKRSYILYQHLFGTKTIRLFLRHNKTKYLTINIMSNDEESLLSVQFNEMNQNIWYFSITDLKECTEEDIHNFFNQLDTW